MVLYTDTSTSSWPATTKLGNKRRLVYQLFTGSHPSTSAACFVDKATSIRLRDIVEIAARRLRFPRSASWSLRVSDTPSQDAIRCKTSSPVKLRVVCSRHRCPTMGPSRLCRTSCSEESSHRRSPTRQHSPAQWCAVHETTQRFNSTT